MNKNKQKIPVIDYFVNFQKSIVDTIVWPYSPEQDSVVRWRAVILSEILIAGLLFGIFAFIAAAALILKENTWTLALVDSLGLILCITFLFVRRIRFEIRSTITLLMFYLIGLSIILSVGPLSGGPAWLFAFAVLAGVLNGYRASFVAILMNAVSLSIIGLLISAGKIETNFPFFKTTQAMIAAGVNFIVLNAITAVPVSALVKGVFRLLSRQEELTRGVEKEQIQLIEAKQLLELEVKERKQTEIELIESEKRFRELAEMLPETIYEVDLAGNLMFVNLKAFDLLGYTKEDFDNGLNIFELIHEKDKARAAGNIEKILRGEEVGINEFDVRKKDGSFIPALLHSSIIYKNDRPVGLRGFLIDISEKKHTQKLLAQNEKMMSVGGLAAGMAHEINNPLAGMIQNAQVIRNRITKDLPANLEAARELGTSLSVIKAYLEKRDIVKLLDSINQAGSQAARIVENMLSFARKDGGERTEQRLGELVDRVIELAHSDYNLKKKYDFKKIEIIRDYGSNVPSIVCEESKIQQVLLNLIKNSAEAMSSNDSPHDPPKLVFRLRRLPTMVCLEIEDNGPGMPQKIQERVFEPFFTTKSVNEGTGLGLSVSYFIIVDDHKGEMEVESTPGVGTRFIIKLPIDGTL